MTQNYIKTRVRLPNNNESNLFTYVPVAGYTDPGIAAFNENHFTINTDTHVVSLNATFYGQYALKSVTITGVGYLIGGGDLSANRSIDINTETKSKIDNALQSLSVPSYMNYAKNGTNASVSLKLEPQTSLGYGGYLEIKSDGPSDGLYVDLVGAGIIDGAVSSTNKIITKSAADNYYGRLSSDNTWSGDNEFDGNVQILADSGDVSLEVSSIGVVINSRYGSYFNAPDSGYYHTFASVIRYAPGVSLTNNQDLTTKLYVDTGLSTKVNKLTSLESPAAYIGNPNGTQTYKYLNNLATGDSVPLRDADGNIYVGNATQTGHAVNLGVVQTLIQEQIGRVYKPAGSITFAELINTVDLDEEYLGNIYNITDNFTTTSDFLEGAGVSYPEGTNVAVVQVGNDFYFDVLVGATDLSGYAYLEATSNYFSGSMEIGGDLQVYGNLLNINGHPYVNADDEPFEKGTGHDSAVLKATPNAADPSVVRTNTVTGDFSAVVAGSRNVISATESAAIGGIITITGGGNNLGAGYRQTMNGCENMVSSGYRNTSVNTVQSIVIGRNVLPTWAVGSIFVGRDIIVTGTEESKISYDALLGYDLQSTASYAFSSGLHNRVSNGAASALGGNLITSKYGQLNCGQYNKSNDQAYLVVGSGVNEGDRKNCFAAGWDASGTTEDERKVIWIGDTKVSEKQIKTLATGRYTNDIVLYAESGDSPRLTFQRGTYIDNLNDWSLYDHAGFLYIQQKGSTEPTWEDRAVFYQNGVNFAGTIQENGVALSAKYLSKSTGNSQRIVSIASDGSQSNLTLGSGLSISGSTLNANGTKLYLHNIRIDGSGSFVKIISTDATPYNSYSIYDKDFLFVSGRYGTREMIAFSGTDSQKITVAYSDGSGGVELDTWDLPYLMDMQDTVTEL